MNKTEITKKFNEFRKSGQIEFVTFHPAYSYEEFIEGLTVQTDEGGDSGKSLKYILKPGLFKNFCTQALLAALGVNWREQSDKLFWKDAFEKYQSAPKVNWDKAPKFVLVVDEINRGDISKILGELITLLEVDKRLGAENELIVRLPNSREEFGVPPNVYIVGTMNTADRSIALLDVALRRRFGFQEVRPDLDLVLEEGENENLANMSEKDKVLLKKSVAAIKEINKSISQDRTLGKDKCIGHSFFLNAKDEADLISVWRNDVLPLLEEYCYGNESKKSNLLFMKDEIDFSTEKFDESLDAIIDARK